MLRSLPLLLVLTALPSAASAHRLDEYLQATLVSIEPDAIRLHINLTPGVAVADVVLAVIDRDHDGAISPDEAAAYAELLRRDLIVGINGVSLELKVAARRFPTPAELRTGSGIVQVEFVAAAGALRAGTHGLTLENRHLPAASAYLLNAARPNSPSVWITRQTRNDNQSAGAIEFTFHPRPNASGATLRFAPIAIVCAAIAAAVWRARKLAPRPRLP